MILIVIIYSDKHVNESDMENVIILFVTILFIEAVCCSMKIWY